MKNSVFKEKIINVTLTLLISLIIPLSLNAEEYKWIKIGNHQQKFYERHGSWDLFDSYYKHLNFTLWRRCHNGFNIFVKSYTDTLGEVHPYGGGSWWGDGNPVGVPIPDENGIALYRNHRYNPPSVTVDGFPLQDPFPLKGDTIAPARILGTAEVMCETRTTNAMGITFHFRALAWSQKNHDDYILTELTIINTGNVDTDTVIELSQTLDSIVFNRETHWLNAGRWGISPWNSCYGERPGDSLRISYAYPSRSKGSGTDNFGEPQPNGFLKSPLWVGTSTLYAPISADDSTNDPAQPQMTGGSVCCGPRGASEYETWRTFIEGFNFWEGQPYMTGTYPGTHHTERLDEQGYKFMKDFPWWWWRSSNFHAYGPYTLEPGDSITLVEASVIGAISVRTAWDVGRAWLNGEATWPGDLSDLGNYFRAFENYPDLAPTENDQAKDRWVCTGKDSLFKNALAALWAFEHNYEVPVAPPPPSIEVSSKPDKIVIEWGDESESVADFAGYRVYRAIGNPGPYISGDELIGEWELIFECGEGTGNSLVHIYNDIEAQRGQAYYYYVSAFDDGTHPEVSNPVGFNGVAESLESGKYYNMTTQPAYITREPGEDLTDIRVVPNPYNIGAKDFLYTGEPDKLMFLNLPPTCTIKIYNEAADLIKVIEHTDGSGDEAWADESGQNFMVTSSNQIPVSGLYIAHIETPDGRSTNVHFLIVR